MADGLEPQQWLLVAGVAAVAAVVVHELGHLLAAGAFGGRRLRLVPGWPAFRVEAELPDVPGAFVVFVAAGALANIGAAVALVGLAERLPLLRVVAVVQVAMAVLAALPIGHSDGAQLLAWWRRQRTGV
ncbi:MAG TPA: hypothetical protein VGF99_01985 [Myxococcota bacterium]